MKPYKAFNYPAILNLATTERRRPPKITLNEMGGGCTVTIMFYVLRRARRSRPTLAFTFKRVFMPSALRFHHTLRRNNDNAQQWKKHQIYCEPRVGRDLRARRSLSSRYFTDVARFTLLHITALLRARLRNMASALEILALPDNILKIPPRLSRKTFDKCWRVTHAPFPNNMRLLNTIPFGRLIAPTIGAFTLSSHIKFTITAPILISNWFYDIVKECP